MEYERFDNFIEKRDLEEFIFHLSNILRKIFKRRKLYTVSVPSWNLEHPHEYEDQLVYWAPAKEKDERYGRVSICPFENNTFEIFISLPMNPSSGGRKGIGSSNRLIQLIENLVTLTQSVEDKSIKSDVSERFKQSIIHLHDHKGDSHEVILKEVDFTILDEVQETAFENQYINVELGISFLFELINVSELSPPLHSNRGGREYERVKKRTLVGK